MSFIHDNFLLENKYAEELYHNYSKKQPIIDYHNHLSPQLIAEDHIFKNITNVWIDGDHYKWRAMRTLGIQEEFITGKGSDKSKFLNWAKTVPHTMRNPLYHWTHLELARYFDVYDLLNEKSAEKIYEEITAKINTKAYSTKNLLRKVNTAYVCTTEDPVDTLIYHQQIAKSNFEIKVGTSFRPDKAILICDNNYNDYIDSLAQATNKPINNYNDLCDALTSRIEFFNKNGCNVCDHGLAQIYFENFTENEVKEIFKKKRENKKLSTSETLKFKSAILLFLAETYHKYGWVQQYHLGALRNNNKRMLKVLGPDTGWDSIGDYSQAQKLSAFLNALDSKDKLAKTIIYNLNPADNEVMATMIGNFNDGSVRGKVQFGSGWWFLDQKDGMTKQLNALSNMGLISCFIGMLTDSRSFLSFPRHEYFRRILCNLLGDEIKRGELPKEEMEWIGKMVADISYNNAKEYFKI
ncbi:glucuronate isomerase [Polaribacter reichenbachii]|uniref:Uronate isomerase n=1 Tax=Polaribacter reichenbachii TaxID=996801 RepID=A0A1B8U638_9FLAO|nr:glucuronate isomerase [Polaribacter reichenbachii]APZ45948.1 glucuronate isomerase [Polaribacter reichenbachii]AUC19810.1 glucuronate isomerase [Polaribacter reichenbachii]OBY67335.1 glucuronate isomerase [Polaribacter reichenbachii]